MSPSLNPEQQAAVDHGDGPLLVIAGAGSGKTRVLTSRVAALLERGAPPEGVLAFTFTNRAAREMRGRIEAVVPSGAERLWIGTFHATALRLLRREARMLGLPPGFTVYDREDSESIVRQRVKDRSLPEAAYRTGTVLGRISDAKNALVDPAAFRRAAVSPYEVTLADLYEDYEAALTRAGALDFDDLIARAVRLLIEHPDAAERWGRRFQHVLVDEYQDTNHAQFRLVERLAAVHGNVFVVGDDDQSIYGWRGADLANVLDFERAWPGARVIRLEQNYRSTNTILQAANAVIAHNVARKGKNLWSEREQGRPLRFVLAGDEADEARQVRRWLDGQAASGRRRSDCAVLYRTNAQSRALELELRQSGIAYEIVGGVSFYQRREVKDLLAYLRLVVNPADTVSFFRVWNLPRRGLGAVVRAAVEARMTPGATPLFASGTGPDPVAALRALLAEGGLAKAARAGATQFLAVLDDLRAHAAEDLGALGQRLLERTGYLAHLEATSDEDFAERQANIEELVASAASFSAQGRGGLLEYLSETALLTDADRVDESADRVLLLTVHNAKGLEFPVVAITGLEEGLMPHASARDDAAQLEEERRLFYVALTRAADEILLSAAAARRRFDGSWGAPLSRFLEEIPAELVERDLRGGVRERERIAWGGGAHRAGARPRRTERGDDARFDDDGGDAAIDAFPRRTATSRRAVGRIVHHDLFGRGTVLDADGEGPDMKLTVRFAGSVKKVFARFVTGGDDVD